MTYTTPLPGDLLQRLRTVARQPLERVVIAEPGPAPANALCPPRARFFLIESGCRQMQVLVDGMPQDLPFKPGTALFAPSDSWHKPIMRGRFTLVTVIFDPRYTSLTWKALPRTPTRRECTIQRAPGFIGPVEPVLQALSALSGRPSPAAIPLLQSLVELVAEEFEQRDTSLGKGHATWQAVSEYLHESFDQPLDRSAVAAALQLHPNHISRLCRRHAGIGFSEYLTRLRLEHATILLRAGRQPIKTVARACGYASENYFAKVFRRRYGMSPGAFRRNAGPA